ncbi:hypothetical protein RDABS01_033569 [Bienertia sinuspersici]
MSDHVTKPSHDEDATSMTSSQAHLPSWMSRWINGNSKPGSAADNSSLVKFKEVSKDTKGCLAQSDLSLQLGNTVRKGDEETKTATINENLSKNAGDFKDKVGKLNFQPFRLRQNKDKASTVGTEGDHEFGHNSMALALAPGKEDASRGVNSRSSKQQVLSHLYHEQKGIAMSKSSAYKNPDASNSVVVFERHFSNDNFTCFSQDRCKYQKSSSVLFHEKKMENDLCHESGASDGLHLQHVSPPKTKNFQSLFLKKQPQSVPGQPLDRVPCSFRNVETMRICTMVDSVENSPGDPPKFSQRAHHILFTKETCVNLSKGHQVVEEPTLGRRERNLAELIVKNLLMLLLIQEGEGKETTGNPSTCKVDSRNEASAETDGMQVEATKNRHIISGMESSPLTKEDTVDENSPPAACDSSTEKVRSKRLIKEIPDINEELPGLQPAVSSTDGKEPSTSRVRSLNAKQLFSCNDQTSRSECNVPKERSLGPDTSNRWIKRLKLSSSDSLGVGTKSSDMGEGSSHEKFNTFFNRIMKCNKQSFEANLPKDHGKEMAINQTVESLGNDESSSMGSKKRKQSTMLGCSWIQRWCQRDTALPPSNPEPLVICEPHSLKHGQDELAKKQFPSIAAMAMMGKAMHGIPSCEFKKRGSVVVWNTKEY